MTSKLLFAPLTLALLLAVASPAFAEDSADPIYGQELMTAQEQERHRARVRELRTEEEREALRAVHRNEIQARARERGVDAPIYGQQLMTQEERQRYRDETRATKTDSDRATLQTRHRTEMQARAQARRETRPDGAAPGPDGPNTVRGRDLMTEPERQRQRNEIHSKTTAQERERARRENHEEMQERARQQGKALPDQPLPQGSGGRGGRGGRR